MTNKTKADEAVSMLEGEPMVERADAAMTLQSSWLMAYWKTGTSMMTMMVSVMRRCLLV